MRSRERAAGDESFVGRVSELAAIGTCVDAVCCAARLLFEDGQTSRAAELGERVERCGEGPLRSLVLGQLAPAQLVQLTEQQGADGHCGGLGQEIWSEVVYRWLRNTLLHAPPAHVGH